MNIALVIFKAEVERGGAERYVQDLGRALVGRGHRVTVLASRGAATDGVSMVRIHANGMTRAAKYRRFCSNLEHHLHAERYDIVHACLPVPRCDVYHTHSGLESLSLRDGHLKHDSLGKQAAAKLLSGFNRKRQAYAHTEALLINSPSPPVVLCLSNRERDEAKLFFPGARERFVTLYSLPDDSRFSLADVAATRKRMRKQLSLNDAQTMFLFIGNDFARKGLATAIRAIGKMTDPQCMLFVVGEGDNSKYSQIALNAGAVGRVMFLGKSDNVREVLTAADALVLPTRSEPFGMVVVEAILMGVPPIVSRVAGASEIIEDARNGFVIDDPNNVDAWAAAMTKLTDRAAREAMAEACLAQRDEFSYENHVNAIEAIYARCKTRKNA